jgi:hypothetical protein
MGEKSKGRDASKGKKPKAPKVGHRPHEERERQAVLTPPVPVPGRGLPVERG